MLSSQIVAEIKLVAQPVGKGHSNRICIIFCAKSSSTERLRNLDPPRKQTAKKRKILISSSCTKDDANPPNQDTYRTRLVPERTNKSKKTNA